MFLHLYVFESLDTSLTSKKKQYVCVCVCMGACHSTPHGFCGSPEASVVHWGLKHSNHTVCVCAKATGRWPFYVYNNISVRLHTS